MVSKQTVFTNSSVMENRRDCLSGRYSLWRGTPVQALPQPQPRYIRQRSFNRRLTAIKTGIQRYKQRYPTVRLQ